MKCPICGCEESEKLYDLCSNMKILGSAFPEAKSDVVSCKKCGLVYVKSEYTQANFTEYYKSANHNNFSDAELYGEERMRNYFCIACSHFDSVAKKNAKVLDIGGGAGDIDVHLTERGYKDVSVMEISDVCLNNLKDTKVHGIKADVFSVPAKCVNAYDLIMCLHTLEHFYDISGVIASARKMLKKGGYLYIEVPDASNYTDEQLSPFNMFTYEHIYHFGLNDLKNMAKEYGIELVGMGQFNKAQACNTAYALYRNVDVPREDAVYSSETRDAVAKYIEWSDGKLRSMVSKIESSGERLILWGIGCGTALLMNKTFDNCPVIQLIDRNKARQGVAYTIGGKRFVIEDPAAITDKDATIVVLPSWSRDSIIQQIRAMGFTNKVRTLE